MPFSVCSAVVAVYSTAACMVSLLYASNFMCKNFV